jgi:dihydroxy-acid dehydratase
MIAAPIRPSRIITAKSVENALRVLLSLGGSTNAIIHLTAVAGRLGIGVSLERLNQLSDETPVLVNLKPVGNHYMEEFFFSPAASAPCCASCGRCCTSTR